MKVSRRAPNRKVAPPTYPVQPVGRLWTEPWPWMRYTGVSRLAALITWFRAPKYVRCNAMLGARAALSLVLLAMGSILAVVMLFHWLRG